LFLPPITKIGIFTDTFLPEVNGVVSVLETMAGELSKEGPRSISSAPITREKITPARESTTARH